MKLEAESYDSTNKINLLGWLVDWLIGFNPDDERGSGCSDDLDFVNKIPFSWVEIWYAVPK